MALPDFVADRAAWDRETEQRLRGAFPNDPAGLARAMEKCYPISVEQAVSELQARGFRVNMDTIALHCDLSRLKTMGRSYLFFAADVDDVAESLAAAGRFGGLALKRKNEGISYTEEAEAIRHIHDTRRERAAMAIGVTVHELNAAIRVGALHDPAHRQIDVEEAKAWFEANAQDGEYQHELQTQEVM